MADGSLNHSVSALNLNYRNLDKLSARLEQAHAMSVVATSKHFLTHTDTIIQSYLWLLSIMLNEAQQALKCLFESENEQNSNGPKSN